MDGLQPTDLGYCMVHHLVPSTLVSNMQELGSQGWGTNGGVFALRAHCALLLDYVPPEEPPSRPLGNALRIR